MTQIELNQMDYLQFHWKILFSLIAILIFVSVNCFSQPSFNFSSGLESKSDQRLIPGGSATMGLPDNAQELKNNSPLLGKRICINPGHGGSESGAVGVGGLRECAVNLKVALILRDLLEGEGAIVFMTRTGDTSVGILECVKFNKAHNTDLFVSIHHNANAQIDRTVNRIESFYHWKDEGGPSEDAARLVHRELEATFRLPDSKTYMCWAYGVLRENAYPAILAEASYISNPEEEKRLGDEEHIRKEAEAYFRGIKAFFTGGRPEVKIDKQIKPEDSGYLKAYVKRSEDSALIDPQRISVKLDYKSLNNVFYCPDTGLLFGQIPICDDAGTHTITVTARNLAGHTSRLEQEKFITKKSYNVQKSRASKNSKRLKIFGVSGAKGDQIPLSGAQLCYKEAFLISDDNGEVRIDIDKKGGAEICSVQSAGYFPCDFDLKKAEKILLQPIFRGVLSGKVIVIDPEGGGDKPIVVGTTGLRASDVNLETSLYLADYLRKAGANVSLTREVDMGLDNVARVRFGLERPPDIFLTIGHRLPEPGMDEKPGTNVTRIGHRWDEGGNIGKSLIFHLRQMLGTSELGDTSKREPLPTEIHNWSSWEVMHAAQKYTAVYVCPQMFDAPGVEARLSTTAGCRKEALAILYGLIQYFGLDDRKMVSIEGVVIEGKSKTPLQDAIITIDGTLIAQTESDGKFILKYLEPGTHTIFINHKNYKPIKKTIECKETEQVKINIELD